MYRRHLLLAAGSATLLAACGGSDHDEANLVERVQADPELSLLAEAVVAAGLVGTLSGSDVYTVFAPTNAAFGALLTELGTTKDALFADVALLTAVLTYHVIPGRVRAAQVPGGRAVETVQGGIFKPQAAVGGGLEIVDGRNRVSGLVATDISARNGVVHKLDRVLLPADKTIVQTAQGLSDFSILVEAVLAAGLDGALSAAGPLTVFAPTNAAFAALLTELGTTKDALLADTPLLTAVLTYHVVDGRVLKADVPVGSAIPTLQGAAFTVDNTLTITDARARRAAVAATDVLASNGVIHVIDRVILPPA